MFPTKYLPEYPELFIKICEGGGSICDFCAKIRIARSTFYEWRAAHPEFDQACVIGQEITESLLVQEGREGMRGAGFNATVWSILLRNKCNYTEHRKVAINFAGCKTADERLARLDEMVALGKLTVTEAKHMSDYVASVVKINEATEGKKMLEEIQDHLGVKK